MNKKHVITLLLIVLSVGIICIFIPRSPSSQHEPQGAQSDPLPQQTATTPSRADNMRQASVVNTLAANENKHPNKEPTHIETQVVNLGGEAINYTGPVPEQYSEYNYDFISLNKEALFSLTSDGLFTLTIPKESAQIELKANVINKTDMGTSIAAGSIDTSNPNSAVITYDAEKNIFGNITTENGKYVLVSNGKFSALIDANTFYHKPSKPLDDTVSSNTHKQGKE